MPSPKPTPNFSNRVYGGMPLPEFLQRFKASLNDKQIDTLKRMQSEGKTN